MTFSLLFPLQFLRDFLENTVAQTYDVEWKRAAFFRFVEHFSSDSMSQDLKAKVLQMILIPCFAVSFDKGQKIVGGPPAPYQDNADNVVSVFINNVSSLILRKSLQLERL